MKNSLTEFTPGPWRYDYAPGYCGEIIAANGTSVGSFVDEPNAANARLIAAAPALLTALQVLVDSGGIGPESMYRDAREAIALAVQTTKGAL